MLFIIIRLSLILIGTMKFAMHGSKHVKINCYIIEWPHVIFLTQQTQDTTMVTMIPRTGEGPGLDSQGGVTLFNKYGSSHLWVAFEKHGIQGYQI